MGKKMQIELQIDQTSGIVVSKKKEGTSKEEADLEEKINFAISNLFQGKAINWINDFSKLIEEEKTDDAYELFKKKSSMLLMFNCSEEQLNILRKLDKKQLELEKQKDYLLTITGIASKIHVNDQVNIDNVNYLLNNFEFDDKISSSLKLVKANAYAKLKKYNTAVSLYNEILEEKKSDSKEVAFIYRGLAKISNNDEDIKTYNEKAVDKFLEAGDINNATTNILSLADFYYKYDLETSLEKIDFAMSLFTKETLLNTFFISQVKMKKVKILLGIYKNEEAFSLIEDIYESVKELNGIDEELYSIVSLGEFLSKLTNNKKREEFYKQKREYLKDKIVDDNILLKIKLGDIVDLEEELTSELEKAVLDSNNPQIITGMLIYKTKFVNNYIEKISILDDSLSYVNNKDYTLKSHIYQIIASIYNQNGKIEQAYYNYKLSLANNPHYSLSYQECIHMLMDNKEWIKAKEVLHSTIKIIGELPNICYIYGKVLIECKEYKLALKYLKKSSKQDNLDSLISECILNISDDELSSKYDFEKEIIIKKEISLEEFRKALKEFSYSVSSKSRMTFWIQENGKYKWTKKPEEHSKHLLMIFLEAKFGRDSIEIIEEPRAGAGFIDIYVLLSGGLKVVIELKMCGSPYSFSYANSGNEQVLHYLENKNTHIGFLIIFDGRVRDYGKGISVIKQINNNTVFTIAVDVRSKIKN